MEGAEVAVPDRLRKWGRGLRSLFAVIGAAAVLIAVTPIGYWWATWLAGPWDDPRGEVLIVLGASVEEQPIISRDTYRRSMYAVMAWREGGFRKVVVCGNGPAQMMQDFLVFSGIPREAIVADTKSLSTRENGQQALQLLRNEPGRKVLLTSDLHMFRAWRVFRKLGLEVAPRPIPDARSRWGDPFQRWMVFTDLMRESAGIGYYWWKGWI